MLPIQPPFISLYFTNIFKPKNKSDVNYHETFFLSWEDALWQLLKNHRVPKGSKVLIPSYYCWDVVKNMQAHGLEYVSYEINKDLQPNSDHFLLQLKKYQPSVVIILHSVGIENNLFKNIKWLDSFAENTILIEDSVHRVIDPKELKFISQNHFIIDSLRKVVPIQVSRVFSQRRVAGSTFNNSFKTTFYRIKVLFWWATMQLFLIIVYKSRSKLIQRCGNLLAEKAMKIGYEIIGDHSDSSPAPKLMQFLSNNLNIELIQKTKVKQTELYEKLLAEVFGGSGFFKIPFNDSDKKQLRGFPLGIELNIADNLLTHLRTSNIFLLFELNDSPWSTKQKIIYLPMGLHVSNKNIQYITETINLFKKSI